MSESLSKVLPLNKFISENGLSSTREELADIIDAQFEATIAAVFVKWGYRSPVLPKIHKGRELQWKVNGGIKSEFVDLQNGWMLTAYAEHNGYDYEGVGVSLSFRFEFVGGLARQSNNRYKNNLDDLDFEEIYAIFKRAQVKVVNYGNNAGSVYSPNSREVWAGSKGLEPLRVGLRFDANGEWEDNGVSLQQVSEALYKFMNKNLVDAQSALKEIDTYMSIELRNMGLEKK